MLIHHIDKMLMTPLMEGVPNMATRFKLRRDTSVNWQNANPILALGEPGIEIDTKLIKYGDGSTTWNFLPYGGTGNVLIRDVTVSSATELVLSSGIGAQDNWIATISPSSSLNSDLVTSSVAYDTDGNIIVLSSYVTSNNVMVTKISGDGTTIIWEKIFQESEISVIPNGLAVDANGDVFVIVGMSSNGVAIGLLKLLGSSGNITWQKTIFNSNNTYDDYSWAVTVDSQGSAILCGTTNTGSNNYGMVLKIRGDGDWENTGNWSIYLAGEIYYAGGTSVTTDLDNNIYVTGYANFINGSTETDVIFVVKLDSSANIVWQKCYMIGQFSFVPGMTGAGITFDGSGHLYVSGFTWDVPVYATMFKLSTTDGAVIWAKEYIGTTCLSITGYTAVDKDGRSYLLSAVEQPASSNFDPNGHFSRVVYMLVCYDRDGKIVWRRDLAKTQHDVWPIVNSGPLSGQSIAVNNDFISICGYVFEDTAYDYNNQNWYNRGFVAQLDRTGTAFETDSWEFTNGKDFSKFVDIVIVSDNLLTNTPVTFTVVDNAFVPETANTLYQVSSIRASLTHAITLDGANISVTPGGSLDLPRTTAGTITILGMEPINDSQDVWIQQVARDIYGNTYGLGGDSINADQGVLFKFDSDGTLVWESILQNGENYGSDYGGGLCIDSVANQVIYVTGDTNGGFNVVRTDPISGNTVSVTNIPHVNNERIYAQAVTTNAQGHAIVVGYIENSRDSFTVTTSSPGLPGSGSGTLVANAAIFNSGIWPEANSSWYVTNANDDYELQITGVNSWSSISASGGNGVGAQFSVTGNVMTPVYDSVVLSNSGGSYQNGDTLTLDGTSLGGTFSNNVSITVDTVDGDGIIQTLGAITGVFNNANIWITVNPSTDFSQPDTYQVFRSDAEDAFVWSPDWTTSLGTIGNDGFMSVAVDSYGNVFCGGYTASSQYTGLVTKFSRFGTKLWAVTIDDGNENYHNVNAIAVDSNNNLFTNSVDDSSRPWITKLDNITGNIIWQLLIDSNVHSWSACGIGIDAENNVYVASEMYGGESGTMGRDYLIAKFSNDGDLIWQRKLATGNDDYTTYDGWYTGIFSVVGNKFSLGGYTYGEGNDDYADAVLAILPIDGTGTGYWNHWLYTKTENTITRNTGNWGTNRPQELDVHSYAFSPTLISPKPVVNHFAVNDYHIEVKLPQGGEITSLNSITFEDGSTQTTSAQDVPQSDPVFSNQNYTYTVTLEDRGHHVIKYYGQIIIPRNEDIPFPIGTTITIVNGANPNTNNVRVYPDYSGTTKIVGVGMSNPDANAWLILSRGLATLLKVDTDLWYLTGGPLQDDS